MASRLRTTFENAQGNVLAASLELPDETPLGFVLFAHCFSCGKDISAASRIARSLTALGFGVLRFDFTGIGRSEGDFGNAGFSSNVQDLLDAASYLRENYQAPSILMGHSLGGTAVLAAAEAIPEVRAVVTIGAPSSPSHVLAQFGDKRDEIEDAGSANVTLAGRTFSISREFVEDLERQDLTTRIPGLRCALLVFHAPLDDTVSIDEASAIFASARHPKSFVSLDDADHLLTSATDARYVAETTAAWVRRYLKLEDPLDEVSVESGQVHVSERNHRFLRGVVSDSHQWLADEPRKMGGDNLGPDPYEHLLAALGTCTSMTIRMYANHKKLNLLNVDVRLQHGRVHAKDCEDCDSEIDGKVDVLERWIYLEGDLSAAERDRLLQIADRCPVHRTLEGDLHIRTREADQPL